MFRHEGFIWWPFVESSPFIEVRLGWEEKDYKL